MIDRALMVRAGALYVPLMLAAALGFIRPWRPSQIGAALVGFCWCLPSLLALQLLNLHFRWWSFHAQGGLWRGMPVDLYLGWALLWGVLPVLVFPSQRLWISVTAFLGLDLLLMPLCSPVVELSSHWITGEFAAIALVLLPAQLFARWTLTGTCLNVRIWLHVAMSGGIFLFLLPEIAQAVTGHDIWRPLLTAPSWMRSIELQAMIMISAGGVSAAQEFARRGLGTPIPYDPPQRLVVSGLYRYIANPMQICCALTLSAWGVVLRNPWLVLSGVISVIYSLGLAHWDEGEDLRIRFGESWLRYRKNVRNWIPRWRPWHSPDTPIPYLYIAEQCGPCSEVRQWFLAHQPVALKIVAAEDHPSMELDRITYDPMDGTLPETGVAALARGLEHLHFGWAWLGACLRLPLVLQLTQILLDAGGLGPQRIERRSCRPPTIVSGRLP